MRSPMDSHPVIFFTTISDDEEEQMGEEKSHDHDIHIHVSHGKRLPRVLVALYGVQDPASFLFASVDSHAHRNRLRSRSGVPGRTRREFLGT